MAQFNQLTSHRKPKKKPDEFISAVDYFINWAARYRVAVASVLVVLFIASIAFMYFQTVRENKLISIAQAVYEARQEKDPVVALKNVLADFPLQPALTGIHLDLVAKFVEQGQIEAAVEQMDVAISQSTGIFKSILLLEKAKLLDLASKKDQAIAILTALNQDKMAAPIKTQVEAVLAHLVPPATESSQK